MLQQDLNSLVEWCGTWLSFLNFYKCKHKSIGPKSTSTGPRQYYFNLDDKVHQILSVQEQKDLVSHLMRIYISKLTSIK